MDGDGEDGLYRSLKRGLEKPHGEHDETVVAEAHRAIHATPDWLYFDPYADPLAALKSVRERLRSQTIDSRSLPKVEDLCRQILAELEELATPTPF